MYELTNYTVIYLFNTFPVHVGYRLQLQFLCRAQLAVVQARACLSRTTFGWSGMSPLLWTIVLLDSGHLSAWNYNIKQRTIRLFKIQNSIYQKYVTKSNRYGEFETVYPTPFCTCKIWTSVSWLFVYLCIRELNILVLKMLVSKRKTIPFVSLVWTVYNSM